MGPLPHRDRGGIARRKYGSIQQTIGNLPLRALRNLIALAMCWIAISLGGQPTVTVYSSTSAHSWSQSQGWSLDTPLPQKRVNVVAVRGPGGVIYAFGSSPLVDAFNPSTHQWTRRAPLPAPSGPGDRATAVAGSDGKVYVITGSTLEAYDPATNTWTTLAPLPVARSDAAAVTGKDGKIYVIGGSKPNPADATVTLYARGLDVYDPRTNSWQVKAPMPTAREGLGATVGPDGTIYAIGGGLYHYPRLPIIKCLSVVERYNPTTNTWSKSPSLPQPFCGATAGTTSHGTIVVVGGSTVQRGEQGSKITPLTGAILSFNPTSSRWTTISRAPNPRKRAGAVIDPAGTIYLIAGADRFGHATATLQKCTQCILL